MRTSAIATLALAVVASLGIAQEEKKKGPPTSPAPASAPANPAVLHVRFYDADANKDGKITKAELEPYFARLDTDLDGGITQAEFNAAATAARGCAAPAASSSPAEPKKK